MDFTRHNGMKLTYDAPASDWRTGLFLGNGRLGAMLVGTPDKKRIALNHDRIWQKNKKRRTKPVSQHLVEIRKLVRAGKWAKAEQLLVDKLQPIDGTAAGCPGGNHINLFQPAGDLHLTFPKINEFTEYYRELDLDTAVAAECFRSKEALFECETFTSVTHQVIVTHLKCNEPGQITGTFTLSRIEDYEASQSGRASKDTMTLICQRIEDFQFALAARVIHKGGTFDSEGYKDGQSASLMLKGADEIWILIAIATDEERDDPLALCTEHLNEAAAKLETLKQEHIKEHQRLFHRAYLSLGDPLPEKSIDQLVMDMRAQEPFPAFYALLFNYARYLLISSSRPGNWPANEGGIWCEDLCGHEETQYHFDNNIEQNYWPAEVSNLGECTEPLFDFIDQLRPSGRKAARDLFGCRGVYFGISTDGQYAAIPGAWVAWTGAAAWLANHFWWHWEYTQDVKFLRERAYPYLKEIADFYLDFLIKDEDGYYITCPSHSPEQVMKGRENLQIFGRPKGWSVMCVNATMDIALITEVFTNLLAASEQLNLDIDKRPKWRDVLEHLRPWPIDNEQGLREFPPGQEVLEGTEMWIANHFLIPHLYPLFPGELITVDETPQLAKAAKKALQIMSATRIGGEAISWRACCWARLLDVEAAMICLRRIAQSQFTKGLCGLCTWGEPPGAAGAFLVDTNFGTAAAVAEMLLQSHRGVIRILPALPENWGKGEAKGWRARGGFELNFSWRGGCIEHLSIISIIGGSCCIRFYRPTPAVDVRTTEGKKVKTKWVSDNEVIFETVKGETYALF